MTSLTLDTYTGQFNSATQAAENPVAKKRAASRIPDRALRLNQNETRLPHKQGTSPAMLFRHYKGLMARKEAAEWFAVNPPKTKADEPSGVGVIGSGKKNKNRLG